MPAKSSNAGLDRHSGRANSPLTSSAASVYGTFVDGVSFELVFAISFCFTRALFFAV